MCPVDPTNLKTIKPSMIDHELACVKCGYNLVGLMSNGVCPECGRSIKIKTRNVRRYSDNLVNAPLGWLSVLATGSLVLFLASLGVFVSLAVAAWLAAGGHRAGAMVSGAFGVIWFVGVWMVTRPRPVSDATTVDPRVEWAGLRWSARATQAFWTITSVMLVWHAQSSHPAPAWIGLGCFVIAALGLIPTCLIVSNIAFWGSDSNLGGHLRATAWGVGFSAMLISLHVMNVFTKAVVMGGVWASMIALLLIFVVLPFFSIIFCCFQLQGMTRWAILNHATADARDRRLRERADVAARHRLPSTPPLVEGVNPNAFNLGDSMVNETDQERLRRKGHIVWPKGDGSTQLPIDEGPRQRPGRA